jgi:hypothetical protein
VEPQEVDSALDELENRLDRLRSLYEQYFMGIEKIEPTVPRKDVDRRFWILRRTQIRNTARRFRLQTLVQRYNTFQQHWTRICREIENGTYVRHLLKAQKNLGAEPKTWAAKKRLGFFRRDRLGPDGAPVAGAASESRPPQSNGGMDNRHPSIPPSRAEPPMEPAAPQAAAQSALAGRTTESVAAFKLPPAELRPLDLDLEDDAPTLPPPPRAAKPAAPVVRPQAAPAVASNPKTAVAPPPEQRPAVVARPAAPAAPVAPVAPARPPLASAASLPKPAAHPSARPPLPRPQSAGPGPGAGPVPPRPAPSQGPIPPRPAPSQRPLAPRPVAPQSPAAAARPAAAASPKPAPNAASPTSSGLSDERVRQLHAELSAARKQLNQQAVSVDSLAKTLRDTETKLRSQHGGKSVDFQVVIKDGKPIVKPVVRR